MGLCVILFLDRGWGPVFESQHGTADQVNCHIVFNLHMYNNYDMEAICLKYQLIPSLIDTFKVNSKRIFWE